MLRKAFLVLSVVFITSCGTLQLGVEHSPTPDVLADNATSIQSPNVVVTDAPPSVAQAELTPTAAQEVVATSASVVVTSVPPTAAPSESAATSTTAPLTHTVQSGETLFRIALKYGVTVDALRAANGIVGDTIYAGQVLIIPGVGATEIAPTAVPPNLTAAPATGQPSATASPLVTVQWDTSPNALIVYHYGGFSIAGGCRPENYYVPDVKLWGDGRIIWAKTDGTARQVFEGRLTSEQMRLLLQRIVEAGFFEWNDYYDALGGNSWTPRHFWVNLVGRTKEISEHGAAPAAFYELQDFIKNGAGADGHEFVPARGYLTVAPVPEAMGGEPWPDAAIVGFTPDWVGEGRTIEGEALTFVWNLINRDPRSCAAVKSREQVYWVSLQIPELSLK